MEEPEALTLLRRWVRMPGVKDDKYSRGVVGFVTGSERYPGAALLGIHAALATGVGMVRYRGPKSVQELVLGNFPEVVIDPGRNTVTVVGSGIPRVLSAKDRERVARALEEPGFHVVDAGALGIIEESEFPTILTPHQGELDALSRRLSLEPTGLPAVQARAVAEALGVFVLAKGSSSCVAGPEGEFWKLPPATAWLATAGTGDALAGILGALLATNAPELAREPHLMGEVAVVASLVHARAGHQASERHGGAAFTLTQLCDAIPVTVGTILSEQA